MYYKLRFLSQELLTFLHCWRNRDKTLSEHLKERAKERNVKEENILDVFKKPLKIGKIKTDSRGRKSKTYIGEKATVAINPDTGVIVTTYPTSSGRVRRLKGES